MINDVLLSHLPKTLNSGLEQYYDVALDFNMEISADVFQNRRRCWCDGILI